LAEDCREAALVIARFDAPANCAAPAIDLRTLATTGAIGLRRVDGKWLAEPARSQFAERPWFGRAGPADAQALSRLEGAADGRMGTGATREDREGPTPDEDDAVEE
jgi:hypothetical protein